jgi:hypothetical protein
MGRECSTEEIRDAYCLEDWKERCYNENLVVQLPRQSKYLFLRVPTE